MDLTDARFSIPADKYLEKNNVLVYLEDAIHQLLDHKDDNPKVNVNKFLSEYFHSVRVGNHTLFREHSYVMATPHNRGSFVQTFWKCYRNIGKQGDLLSIKEYHSLLCLLCNDIPVSLVQKTAKIVLMDSDTDGLISFTDFIYAFQIQFCYNEFLGRCAEIYKELVKTKQNSHDPVYVPTSEEATPRIHDDDSSRPDGVDAMTLLRSLMPLCDEFEKLAPPLAVLKDILSSAERVTFYGFLLALAKSERLNAAIGKIPNRNELLENSSQDLSSLSKVSSGTSATSSSTSKSTVSPPLVTPATQQDPRARLSSSSGATIATRSSSAHQPLKSARLQKRLLRKQALLDSDNDSGDDSSDT